MATPTDPSFGGGFDASAFRDAITSVMEMGQPNASQEVATFHWPSVADYVIKDNTDNPYDWSASPTNDPTSDTPPPVQVPCALEFVARASLSDGTPFGEIETPKAILTLLDVHYDEVRGATWVMIDGAKYNIDYVAPPTGLFSVTVYSVYLSAEDEN